ncbi:hypothetical protein Ahy_A01g002655 [Arachis hypogaea]|uniref:Uncharacterized protein n=1 Tax=Arachis hypogaea TaxID=3818 RepID=A0A445ERL2_ARAHY|nr:hypothetical protein Ahy_A01g002655 [Arachis hypogaea]
MLLKDKQLILLGKTLLLIKDLIGKPYCKFHQATSHSTNNFVHFKDLIQETIMEGRLKFDDGEKDCNTRRVKQVIASNDPQIVGIDCGYEL